MRTTLHMAIALISLVSSIALGQQADEPSANVKKAKKKATAGNVEFRWLESGHKEGLTDNREHQAICPSCSANHKRFAHAKTAGVARHIKKMSPHKAVRNRFAVEFVISNAGIDAIVASAARAGQYASLGVFVGGEFVGVVQETEKPTNRSIVLLPTAKQTRQLCSAAKLPKLEPPALLARFRFDGDTNDSSGNNTEFTHKNAAFKENALYVNGKYKSDGAPASRIKTPSLNENQFTVAIRFKAYRLREPEYRTILCGGSRANWFHLSCSAEGKLQINLRDSIKHETNVVLKTREWYSVVCEFDIGAKLLQLQVNGKAIESVELGRERARKVAEAEKVWAFSNGARGGSVFHGLVDEVAIYDGTFWPGKLPSALVGDKRKEQSKTSAPDAEKPM